MFWRRRKCHEPQPTSEAVEAVRQADRANADADRRDDAIAEVTERLRQTRLRNHFREAVEDTMRRHA